MTSSSRRYETPDCLFGSDSSNNTQADFATDRSHFATNWSTVSTTGVRYDDASDRFRLLLTRKTIDVRFAAYSVSSTNYLYSHQLSGGGVSRQALLFTGIGLLNFAINASTVSTYQITNFTAGNILTVSWAMEPNVLTTGASDAVRSEAFIYNETAGTFEYHTFTHPAVTDPGANATHAFWSLYSGASGYSSTRYVCRLSRGFHSSTESFETFIGDTVGSSWSSYDGGVASSRIRTLAGGSYLTINPGTTASGLTASPSRTPGPRVYKSVTGNCDIRLRVHVTQSNGRTDASLNTFYVGLLASSSASGATDWVSIEQGRESSLTRRVVYNTPASGAFTTTVATAGSRHSDLRIVRTGQSFQMQQRTYSAAVPLSSDENWTTVTTIDRTLTNTLSNTLQYGPVVRSTAGALTNVGSLGVIEEMYGLDANGEEIDFTWDSPVGLLGRTRLEPPVPTSASGITNDGQLTGPSYQLAAVGAHNSDLLLVSPIINENIKATHFRDSLDTTSTDWCFNAGDGYLMYLEHLWRRPVPKGVNRMHIRLFVQADFDGGLGFPPDYSVRVYSMSAPGYDYRPSTSPQTLVKYTKQGDLLAPDHGTSTSTGGVWMDLGVSRIALDTEGFTYIGIAQLIGGGFAGGQLDVRIRSIICDPVIDVDSDEAPSPGLQPNG